MLLKDRIMAACLVHYGHYLGSICRSILARIPLIGMDEIPTLNIPLFNVITEFGVLNNQ